MLDIPPNIVVMISIVSGICTIIASIIAIITLLIWRKQQRYAPKLNAVMELEDCHELLMLEYYNIFLWLHGLKKLAAASRNKGKEYKSKVDDKIKGDFEDFQKKDKLAVCESNYQMQYARVSRLMEIKDFELLDYKVLYDFHSKSISLLQDSDYGDVDLVEEVTHTYANNFSTFKNNSLEQFKLIRKII
ncbi:hypothetical protein [Pseudoalteromonas xiamenensis]